MIAATAIPEDATRRALSSVLADAGWQVFHAHDADEAVVLCRRTEADVLLVDDTFPGGAIGLLDRLKHDTELFRIAVVIVGDGLAVDDVLSAMKRGAEDVLRTPLDPADVIGRATAAARTKALVKELTAQNNRFEELVFFDELTGLRNRRAIMHDLEMLLAGAERHHHALSVLMLDVDNFKAVNDEHGHRVGDEVLREVARRLEARLRRADVAGRPGGDEMLVVLPDTNAAGADVLARSIRDAVAGTPMLTSTGPLAVTVSLGSAARNGEDVEMLIERADRALYAAKAAGRDQVATA